MPPPFCPCSPKPPPTSGSHFRSLLLRTHRHPGPEALRYAVDTAARSLTSLRGLVERRSSSAGSTPSADHPDPALSDWLEAYCAPPDTLDAVITLREDSLPHTCQVGDMHRLTTGWGEGPAVAQSMLLICLILVDGSLLFHSLVSYPLLMFVGLMYS